MNCRQEFRVRRIVDTGDHVNVEIEATDTNIFGHDEPMVEGHLDLHFPSYEGSEYQNVGDVPFDVGDRVRVVLEGDGFQLAPADSTAASRG